MSVLQLNNASLIHCSTLLKSFYRSLNYEEMFCLSFVRVLHIFLLRSLVAQLLLLSNLLSVKENSITMVVQHISVFINYGILCEYDH